LPDPLPDEFAISENQVRDDLVPSKSFDGRSNADYCPLAKVSVDTRNSCTNYASQFEFLDFPGRKMAEPAAPKMAEEELLRMTADVVAAYVSNNTLPTAQLAEVINAVYNSLKTLEGQPTESQPEPLKPAVPVRKSVTPDYLICLEDGKKLKMLKRHLRSTYSMTPDEYRAKWSLPADYPMVAPNYAEQRSEFAKKIGLGRGTGRQSARRSSGNGAGAKK
jgi:predicted transcriptional regulator